MAPLWYEFGLAVGIDKETLNKFSALPKEDCIVELLDFWLRKRENEKKVTWREVAEAIKQIGLHTLAQDLLDVYKTGEVS